MLHVDMRFDKMKLSIKPLSTKSVLEPRKKNYHTVLRGRSTVGPRKANSLGDMIRANCSCQSGLNEALQVALHMFLQAL